MGIFDKQTDIDKLIKKISTAHAISEESVYKCYTSINDPVVFAEIASRLESYKVNCLSQEFIDELTYLTSILYPLLVTNKNDLNNFYNVIAFYLKKDSIVTREGITYIANAFDNKALIIEVYNYLTEKVEDNQIRPENLNTIINYLTKAREYFVEDRALFSSFVNLTEKVGTDLICYGQPEDIESIIEDKLIEDKKANGIYDLDEATLAEFDRKIEVLGLVTSKLNALIDVAEQEAESLRQTTTNISDEFTSIRIDELNKLREEANKVLKEFNASYLELLNKQNTAIVNERDKILAEIRADLEKERIELLRVAQSVANTVGIELTRIHKAGQRSIDSIESYVANSENVTRAIQGAKANEDLVTKLAFVETMATRLEQTGATLDGETPIIVPKTGSQVVQGVEQVYVPKAQVITGVPEDALPVDYTINYYFDKSKKYKERFKKLMELKAKMQEKGEIFHEKFDDVLTMIICNDVPYMYGPSGCGKTYMIEHQLAKLLGMTVTTNGYIQYEQDIIGYTNAGDGGYVPSNFYRAFRTGEIIFFDELDNSNSNATTVLNSFLTRNENSSYTFPNGVALRRHPNFRIISAGNTKGSGRTVAHNTRQKMDESVMQRLTPIQISYDNRIEKEILNKYPGWYEFATAFREAIESIPSDSGDERNSIGTFTTRDAQAVRDYLDDEAMTDSQLIDYQIIENKDNDYLAQIIQHMEEYDFDTKDGQKLLTLFKKKVETKRENENSHRY